MSDLEAVLDRCRRGDDLAWEHLVRAHQAAVYGLARTYLRDPEEARDVAQEAFVRVYRALDGFDGRRPFRAWLLMVTRNLSIDQIRRRRARPPSQDVPAGDDVASEGPDPGTGIVAEERRALLYRAIDRLSPINREIVLLKEIQGLSLGEISGLLDIPVGTVKSRSNRARVELARHVLDLDPGYAEAAS